MKNTALLIVLSLAAGAVQAQTAGTVTLTRQRDFCHRRNDSAPDLVHQPCGHQLHRQWRLVGHQGAPRAPRRSQNINASTNYTLTCTWGTGSATVNWTAPTTNTDGTPLTNLAAFRVYYGTSSTSLTQVNEVNDISSNVDHDQRIVPGHVVFQSPRGERQPGRISRQQCLVQDCR